MTKQYKHRERRQVSFNTNEADELALLRYIDRDDVNFSGLVKKLLFAYLLGRINVDGTLSASSSQSQIHPSAVSKEDKEIRHTETENGLPFSF